MGPQHDLQGRSGCDLSKEVKGLFRPEEGEPSEVGPREPKRMGLCVSCGSGPGFTKEAKGDEGEVSRGICLLSELCVRNESLLRLQWHRNNTLQVWVFWPSSFLYCFPPSPALLLPFINSFFLLFNITVLQEIAPCPECTLFTSSFPTPHLFSLHCLSWNLFLLLFLGKAI